MKKIKTNCAGGGGGIKLNMYKVTNYLRLFVKGNYRYNIFNNDMFNNGVVLFYSDL